MEKDLISVIVPVYNVKRLVADVKKIQKKIKE